MQTPSLKSISRRFIHFLLPQPFLLLIIYGCLPGTLSAQVNTVPYKLLTDTLGSLQADRNGNTVDLSTEPYLISSEVLNTNSAATPLPFSVLFMGAQHTHFMVNSNGCMVLAPSSAITFTANQANNFQLAGSSYALLAPFWSSLATPYNLGIKYKTIGTAPYRCLVVEWYALAPAASPTATYDLRFQARFYETTHIVEYVYGNMQTGGGSLVKATIGFSTAAAATDSSFIAIRNLDSLSVTRLKTELNTAQSLVNTAASGAINKLHSTTEGQRRRLAFVPDALTIPSNLNAFSVTHNEALLYWDDNSSDETGFNVYRFDNGIRVLDTTVGVNISFRQLTGLLAGTTYKYQVQAFNNYTSSYSNIITFTTSSANVLLAKASGNWTDTATWWGSAIPMLNDSVIIPAGMTITMDADNGACHQLLVNGVLEYADNSSAKKLNVNYNLVNNGRIIAWRTPSFNNVSHELRVGRHLVNNNILNLYNPSGAYTCAVGLVFTGGVNSIFSGSGDTTNLYNLALQKNDLSDSLILQPASLRLRNEIADSLSGTALLSNVVHKGTFKLGGTFAFNNRLFPATTIGTANSLSVCIDNPNFTSTLPLGDITLATGCVLKLVNGTINVQGALALNSSALFVNGGVLAIAGQLKNTSAATPSFLTQNNGRIVTTGVNLNAAANQVNLTGGTLIVNGNANILADLSYSSFSGTKVQFGSSASAVKQFAVNGYYPHIVVDTLVANNSIAKVTLNGSTTIFGNTQLASGDTIDLAGNTLTIAGDSLNIQGTLKGSANSKLSFQLNPQQYVTGSGSIVTDILETDKPDTTYTVKIQLNTPLQANTVLMAGGKIKHTSMLTIGNGTANTILKYGKSSNKQQGGYFDEAPILNIGTGKYSVYYLHESQARATGFEIPSTRKVAGIFFSNKKGITVTGGNIEVYDTLRLDSGIITTAIGNEIILTDTSNHLALTGGNTNAYFKGPFTRSLPSNLQGTKSYIFPVGDIAYKPFVVTNPATATAVDLRVAVFNAQVSGTAGNTLKDIDTTGYWYVKLVNGSGISNYKARIYDTNLNAFSRFAFLATTTTTLSAADVFQSSGKRVAYNIDTLESATIAGLNPTTPVHVFAQGHSIPDTLFSGTYTIGAGGDYLNLNAAAEDLNSSYIDGSLIFEVLQSYDLQSERLPVGFEQSLYTQSASRKNVTVRLAKNVTGITIANDYAPLVSGNALIDLSGADSITFDGNGYDMLGNATGTIEWAFQTTAATVGVPVFRFVNGAAGNTLESLKITGNNNSATSGTILFAGAPRNNKENSYNTVQHCTIGSISIANASYNHIYSKGESVSVLNAHNTISNNLISDASGRHIEIAASGNGPYWIITGNSMFQTGTSANNVIPINFIAGPGSYANEISWNTIGGTAAKAAGSGWNYTGTAVLTTIQVSADTTLPTLISNNTIKNMQVTSNTTTAGFRGIYAVNGKLSVVSNTISGIGITGRAASNMIQMSVNNAASEANDNQVTTITQTTGASTVIRLRGILCDGNAPVSIRNNQLSNLSAMGTNTDYRDASTVGIYVPSANQQVTLSNNKIWNLASASSGCVTGISINGNAAGTINGNNIYNLTNASTTVTRYIMAMNIENGTWNVFNNKISLSNTGNEARTIIIAGIRVVSSSTKPSVIAYNTVHIGGTTSSSTTSAVSYCYSQLSGTYTQLQNNIFANTRGNAAIHWALYASGGNWVNTQSDFNVYYAANATSAVSTNGINGSTLQSFLNTTSGDQSSILNTLPVLKNIPSDISLVDTSANCPFKGLANPMALVTEDYKGTGRNTTQPDPGAEDFTFTQAQPPLPAFVSGNDSLCAGATRILLMSNPPAGNDIEWFAQPHGGTLLFTGRDFATGPITHDTVFYAHTRSGSCKSARIAIPVKAKPVPALSFVNIPQDTVCAGNTHELTVTAAEGNTVNWFTDSIGGISLHTGLSFNTGILSSDTVFYAEASNGICPSIRKKIALYVDSAVILTPPVTDTLVKVCYNSDITLKAVNPTGVKWYAGLTDNIPVIADSLYSLSGLTTDTTVYVASAQYTCESERIKVHIQVYAEPMLPQLDSAVTICYQHPVTLGSNITGELLWYADSVSSTPVFTGNTFTSGALTQDTAFYYSIQNGPCMNTERGVVKVKVHQTESPVVDPVNSICIDNPVSLTIGNAGSAVAQWYTAANTNASIFTGAIFATQALHTDTIFYTKLFDGTCYSETVPVTVDIIEQATAPQVVSVDTVCKGSLATITVAAGGDVKWYNTITSTDVLSTGSTFTTLPLNNDTLFYVTSVYGSCVSSRVAIAVPLRPSPQPPLVAPVDMACAGRSITLTASASDSVKWYSSATSTVPLARDNTFTTPSLTTTTTYYVLNDNGQCYSKRIAVPVTVTPAPAAPAASDNNFRTCYNEPLVLKATGNGAIKWYASANSSIVLQNDSMFMTDRLTRDTVFYAETVNGTCNSTRTAVPVSVLNYLGNVQIMIPDSAIIGTDINIQSQGPQSSIYSWSFGSGSSLSGASGQGPFTLHYNTPGQKLISLSISRKSGNLNCDTTISVRLNVVDTMRVGLSEADPYLAFAVYPNPASEMLHVSFDLKKSGSVALELIDITGRVVWEDKTYRTSGYAKTIDVGGLDKGLFMLRTTSEGFVRTTKIIIN